LSRIRVAVADDSPFIRKLLARMLGDEPDLELAGTAARGEELLAHLDQWQADLIILDLAMPGMGGLATLEEVLRRRPTPVIILSDNLREGAYAAVDAMRSGALDCVDKRDLSLVDFEALRHTLIGRVRQLASGSVHLGGTEPAGEQATGSGEGAHTKVRRRARLSQHPARTLPGSPSLLLIGASTGGPPAVERVLADLGPGVPCPVVVALHMPTGFTRAFAARLHAVLPIPVQEAEDGGALVPGVAYVAPGGFHTTIRSRLGGFFSCLEPTADRVQPSVNLLFASAAAVAAPRAVAVLLTGMGTDGAKGMSELARAGCHTIAQDEATSVVFGMPRAAIAAGAARETLPLSSIGGRLRQLAAAAPEPGFIPATAP